MNDYMERIESERFGPTRSLSEHLATVEQERFTVYKNVTETVSNEPSTESVELLRRKWQSQKYKAYRKFSKLRLLRGKQNGKD